MKHSKLISNFLLFAKCFTSFVVIAVILVCSIVVPAFAAFNVLRPSDYLSNTLNKNGVIYSYYRFNARPVIKYDGSSGSGNVGNENAYYIPNANDTSVSIRYFPLGTLVSGNAPASGAVIDIRDFKVGSVVDIATTYQLKIYYQAGATAVPPEAAYTNSIVYIYFYDVNGNYISVTNSYAKRVDFEVNSSEGTVWALQSTFSFAVPDNCAYMIPYFRCRFEFPQPVTEIVRVETMDTYFQLNVGVDSVLENSETMKKIEKHLADIGDKIDDTNDKLDETNEKLDDIISGSEEQQSAASDAEDQVQSNEQQFDDIMDQLEDYESIDTSTVFGAIHDFLEQDGWKDVRELLSPVLDWTHTATIMLIILSLINLSIILFGR